MERWLRPIHRTLSFHVSSQKYLELVTCNPCCLEIDGIVLVAGWEDKQWLGISTVAWMKEDDAFRGKREFGSSILVLKRRLWTSRHFCPLREAAPSLSTASIGKVRLKDECRGLFTMTSSKSKMENCLAALGVSFLLAPKFTDQALGTLLPQGS